MTRELTSEQRLTQIEKILESAIKLSHSNTAKIEANAEAIAMQDTKIDRLTQDIAMQDTKIDRLTQNIDRATEIFIDSMGVMRTVQTNIETVQTNIETVQTNIEVMRSEIKGLQLENRRILDRLFGAEDAD